MDHEPQSSVTSFLSGLMLGAVIGAGIALLTAPQAGRRTRRRLRRTAGDLRETATDAWEELADEMKDKVDEVVRGARGKLIG